MADLHDALAAVVAHDRALTAQRLRDREQGRDYVTPARARALRVLLDSEHADAVRAGEVPPGPRRLELPQFPQSAPRPSRRPPAPEPPAGLW